MRKSFIIPILMLVAMPFIGFGQGEKKISSALLNIELPAGANFEANPDKINTSNAALENFASTKGYKLAKGKPEVFHTDFDEFKTRLSEGNFEITQEEDTDFYKITKGKNKYLAYVKEDETAFQPSGKMFLSLYLSAALSQTNLLYNFGVTTTITIKRCY